MVEVSYVYPNVSGIPQRGGLMERWHLARSLGCGFVEVPADFIKNKTEMNKTGLSLGDFLTDQAVATLYTKDDGVSEEVKYVLHTEPSLPRNDGYGVLFQAPLKWYDGEWVEKFVSMMISLSRFFGVPGSIIEIHPGNNRNSFENLVQSVTFLLDTYKEEFSVEPQVFLENRTGQFISTGSGISRFWKFLSEKYPQLKSRIGIILDVQQLYTATRKNFLTELAKIPLEALTGFHIHYKHRVPDLSNEISWKHVFDLIANLRHKVIINPEILHKNKVETAINFCEKMLQASR